jgi:hypothetical protein
MQIQVFCRWMCDETGVTMMASGIGAEGSRDSMQARAHYTGPRTLARVMPTARS